MTDTGDDPFAALPLDLQQEVIAVCDRFEAALRSGQSVRAEEFLPPPGPATDALLSELLLTELEHRFRSQALTVRVLEAAKLAAGGGTAEAGRPSVGPYLLVRLLGGGGFGSVFLATDTRSGQEVALKVPHPGALLDPRHRARLLQEGEAAARLDHPHVARVFGAGEAGPVCYLAFEYVPGQTLAYWLAARQKAGQPVGFREAAGLLRPVAAAVAHAHANGVLHLDLTPANILLRDGTWPVVTDFGLARLVGEPSDLSASGVIVGTLAYLAPELAAGRRAKADTRSDVYALGAILYELLGGRPPFTGEHLPELLTRAAAGYPDWPRRLRSGVPARLESICLRCLEPVPSRRYPAAAGLEADLERFLADQPPATPLVGLATRLRWWWGRNPGRAAARLLVGLAVACLLIVAGYHYLTISRANWKLATANNDLVASSAAIKQQADELRRRGYSGAVRHADDLLAMHEVAAAQSALDEYRPRPGESDQRGFEWHLLRRRCTPSPHRLVTTFPAAATAVAVAPGGRLAAAGGESGEVRLFDPTDGEFLYPPLPHPGAVEFVAFSPDGRALATACADGFVRVWRLGDQRPPMLLPGHTGRVQCVAWAPDGRRLVSGGRDGTVRWWDASGAVCRAVTKVGASVRTVAWAADGASVFVGGDRPTNDGLPAVRVISPEMGEVIGYMPEDRVTVAGGFLPGNRVVSAHRDGTVRVWRAGATGGWVEGTRLTVGHPRVNDLAVRPDRDEVAVCLDGAVEVWRLDPPTLLAVFRSPDAGRLWAAAWTPSGTLVTAGADGAIRAWEPVAEAVGLTAPGVDWLAFHQGDGRTRLAAGGVQGTWIWELRDRLVVQLGLIDQQSLGGGFTPDGTPLTVGLDGSVWRMGHKIIESVGSKQTLSHPYAAIDPTGERIAMRLPDAVQLQTIAGGPTSRVHHENSVTHLSFGPDHRLVATSADRTLLVWSAEKAGLNQLARLSTGNDRPTLAAAGPAGWLAAGIDVAVLVWGDGDTLPRYRLVGHRGRLTALAFAPDGRTLATGGEDGTVRLWHLDTGQEALTLSRRPTAIRGVQFSRDGRYLVACDAQGVFVYDAK